MALRLVRRIMVGGVGLSRVQQAQNARDRISPVEGMGPVGEMRLLPDPTTFRIGFVRRMEDRLAERHLDE